MNLLNIFALSGLANFILSVTFGILVYLRNRQNIINIVFLLLSLPIAIWSLSYYFWLNSDTKEAAIFWLKILASASVLIPIIYFHWLLVLLDNINNKKLKLLLIVSYIFGAIIILAGFLKTNLVIKDVRPKLIFPYWPDAGVLYSFYILGLYIGLVILSIILTSKNFLIQKDPKVKNNLLFLIISTILGFGGGFTNFFLWYDINILPYGNILVGLYVLVLGYATLEFRFFQIKLIGTEFFTFILILLLIINLFRPTSTFYDFIFNLGVLFFALITGTILLRYAYKEYEYATKLEQLNRIKSEFLSFASHQVKAPMAVVKGYAELIADGIENVPEQAKDFAKKIKDSVNNLLVLIEEFMDYRRIEEGKMELNFEEVEIISLIKEIINNFMLLAKEKNLDLIFETNFDQLILKVDKIRFAQIIQNLIDNAIKYTPQGWVKVNVYKENNKLVICVSDSGIGMSKELQSKLFGEFVRDPSIKKEIRGTGLGLYIVKYLVESHQGKIWAESEGEGKGSKFYVELPITKF